MLLLVCSFSGAVFRRHLLDGAELSKPTSRGGEGLASACMRVYMAI